MRKKKLAIVWVAALAVLLGLAASPVRAVDDAFNVGIDEFGNYAGGGGTGYGGGAWYGYPNLVEPPWWNQWFYNAPYNPNRWKEFVVDIPEIHVLQPGTVPAYAWIAFNWSTPEWSLLGNNRPPLPSDVPTPLLENLYIGRQVVWYGTILETMPMQVHQEFSFDNYNPEWVSIDVRGYNFVIPGGYLVLCPSYIVG